MLFVNLRPWAKYPDNSEVQAQTPPFRGGVWAWTALFYMASIVAYGVERVNENTSSNYIFKKLGYKSEFLK